MGESKGLLLRQFKQNYPVLNPLNSVLSTLFLHLKDFTSYYYPVLIEQHFVTNVLEYLKNYTNFYTKCVRMYNDIRVNSVKYYKIVIVNSIIRCPDYCREFNENLVKSIEYLLMM